MSTNINDYTNTQTNTKNNTIKDNSTNNNAKSLARLWRQLCFIPILHTQWLTDEVKDALANMVTVAETGHRGEVFLIIENHLPIATAYHQGCRGRAIDLFSEYRIWDTEENTGVLVYVNVCEHDLEIVADRGINQHVSPSVWQAMCDKAIVGLSKGKIVESLSALLDEIGQLLRQYYYLEYDPQGNELSDSVVHLT